MLALFILVGVAVAEAATTAAPATAAPVAPPATTAAPATAAPVPPPVECRNDTPCQQGEKCMNAYKAPCLMANENCTCQIDCETSSECRAEDKCVKKENDKCGFNCVDVCLEDISSSYFEFGPFCCKDKDDSTKYKSHNNMCEMRCYERNNFHKEHSETEEASASSTKCDYEKDLCRQPNSQFDIKKREYCCYHYGIACAIQPSNTCSMAKGPCMNSNGTAVDESLSWMVAPYWGASERSCESFCLTHLGAKACMWISEHQDHIPANVKEAVQRLYAKCNAGTGCCLYAEETSNTHLANYASPSRYADVRCMAKHTCRRCEVGKVNQDSCMCDVDDKNVLSPNICYPHQLCEKGTGKCLPNINPTCENHVGSSTVTGVCTCSKSGLSYRIAADLSSADDATSCGTSSKYCKGVGAVWDTTDCRLNPAAYPADGSWRAVTCSDVTDVPDYTTEATTTPERTTTTTTPAPTTTTTTTTNSICNNCEENETCVNPSDDSAYCFDTCSPNLECSKPCACGTTRPVPICEATDTCAVDENGVGFCVKKGHCHERVIQNGGKCQCETETCDDDTQQCMDGKCKLRRCPADQPAKPRMRPCFCGVNEKECNENEQCIVTASGSEGRRLESGSDGTCKRIVVVDDDDTAAAAQKAKEKAAAQKEKEAADARAASAAGMSTSSIAVIAVGAAVLIAGGGAFLYFRRSRMNKAKNAQGASA